MSLALIDKYKTGAALQGQSHLSDYQGTQGIETLAHIGWLII